MNYALGHSFNLHHIFKNFNIKRIKTNYKILSKYSNTQSKIAFCIKIFQEHLRQVLEDIILNDVTFILPTTARPSNIHLIKYKDDDFIKARKNGKFKEVDFLSSNFTGYQLGLFMYGLGRTRIKTIYVEKDLKELITQKTNQGHDYA